MLSQDLRPDPAGAGPPWQSRSTSKGSKSQQASDIVFGDNAVFGGTTQFDSTMKKDYGYKSLAQDPGHDMVPAGKCLGIGSKSNSEIHVVFGDMQKSQTDRLRSVTAECYEDPGKKVYDEPPKRTLRQRVDKRLEPWEGRSELIMAAAHIGLKTRETALPVDDKRFKNFVTTHQEVYHRHATQRAVSASLTASPYGASSIPVGDPDKQCCYESVAASSFVQHPPSSYGQTAKAEAPPAGAVLVGDPKYLGFFDSTSSATYKGPSLETLVESRIRIHKDRGRSSIAFGESIQLDDTRKATAPTVAQRDFHVHPNDVYVEARRKVAESRPTTFVGDGCNLGSVGALRPNRDVARGFVARDEHQRDATSLAFSAAEARAAGNPSSRPASRNYRSSIVTGDPSRYTFGRCTTTTNDCFQAYEDAEFPTFPIAGANITRSNFSLGDMAPHDPEDNDREMVSTTAAAFVNYGTVKPAVRKPQEHSFIGTLNDEYPMSKNITSNAQFYRDYAGRGARAQAIPPKSAPATLLFPLRTQGNQHMYETSTISFFRPRDGLVHFKHRDGPDMNEVNRASSIAFGDRRHFNTLGLPVLQQETQAM
ncbi:hypothetical protein HDU96_003990 [Phlyctochytrium bullatum]|nr:hypothetical protein HDU96_003990 [Phlyctochytrium bullatum]